MVVVLIYLPKMTGNSCCTSPGIFACSALQFSLIFKQNKHIRSGIIRTTYSSSIYTFVITAFILCFILSIIVLHPWGVMEFYISCIFFFKSWIFLKDSFLRRIFIIYHMSSIGKASRTDYGKSRFVISSVWDVIIIML